MAVKSMTLDDLTAQLRAAYGASLEAVVLYGSAASNEAVSGQSDQNVLVIVRALSLQTLRTLGQTVRAWQEAGNPPPLTLTSEEWARSSDIFPMEYADILERHRTLDGRFNVEGISIDPVHLRLQTEQEAMGKLIRLRRGAMMAGTDAKRQSDLLRDSLSSLLVIFRAVLRLHGEQPPRDAISVIQSVASHAGFDRGAFERTAELVRGSAIPAREIEAVMTGYLAGMDALVQYLDRYAPPSAA